MENKKLENQEISDNNAENVAGGIKFHVDTTAPFVSKVDSIYISKKDYSTLKKVGAIDKDNVLDATKLPNDLSLGLDMDKDQVIQATASKPKAGEVKVKIYHPLFNLLASSKSK